MFLRNSRYTLNRQKQIGLGQFARRTKHGILGIYILQSQKSPSSFPHRLQADPVRELTDDQIKDVYRLWTGGNYSEFMRKVHAGELPRWVAMNKQRADYVSSGKGKTVDLAELRTILEKRFSSSNLHEVWGYTNLPYVAI